MSGPGGRPRKYKTPEDFTAKVDEYVKNCRESEEPITWTGLALYMGFCSRSAIDEYKEYEGFLYPVKRAKMIVENAYEKRLAANNPTGPIFALKNMGWSDKQDINHTSEDGTMSPKDHTAAVLDAIKRKHETKS